MKFWKMHGLGNDYIVIDNRNCSVKEEESSTLAKKICQRRFSVGADGLILLLDSNMADVRMRIINADGSEAEMCGNGIRCLAKYCFENKIVRKKHFTVETLAGLKPIQVFLKNGSVHEVHVEIGKPLFNRSEIPMRGEGRCIDEPLIADGREFRITCLSVGNPHCVIFIDDIKDFPVEDIGSRIERNKLFPKRVNVEFAQIVSKEEMWVRVWERGVGETLACGTGACAAVVAGNILGRSGREVTVNLLGGDLRIEYDEEISMLGPTEKAFEGIILVKPL
ncbi:MAG: diaminopimelate epimerase [Candidatus Bathyarchaeota archaeon]